jgi:hypothetical protein
MVLMVFSFCGGQLQALFSDLRPDLTNHRHENATERVRLRGPFNWEG